MTALASGNPFGTSYGAPDLKARERTHLRRGLLLSGILHLALLAALVPLWSGGGETLVRTVTGRIDVLPEPPTLLPPLVSPGRPARSGPSPPNGVPVPVLDRVAPVLGDPKPVGIDPVGPWTGNSEATPASPSAGPGPSDPGEDPPEDEFRYFDEPPVAIYSPKPEYPDWAREAGVSGRVLLHVLVGSNGTVRRVVVIRGVTGLSEAARDALARWSFRPARAAGKPVAVWVAVPVEFRL